MDVIANAGSVWRWPVVTKHSEFRPAAYGHLSDEGEQIVGDAVGVFPNPSTGVGAYGIEVAQPSDAPATFAGLDWFSVTAAPRQICEQ